MNGSILPRKARRFFSPYVLSFGILLPFLRIGEAQTDCSPRTYSFGTYPMGDCSWADTVISFSPGTYDPRSGPPSNSIDPALALGCPNNASNTCGNSNRGYVCLGVGGSITLGFENRIINSGNEDDDLVVFEIGSNSEQCFVALHADEPTSILLGEAGYQPDQTGFFDIGVQTPKMAPIDLDGYFPGFSLGRLRFDQVRIIDDPAQGGTTGATPGADIDAVGSLQRDEGDISLERIELYQAVEAGTEEIPLIAMKPILIRVHAAHDRGFPEGLKWSVRFHAYKIGASTPFNRDRLDGPKHPNHTDPETDLEATFNFYLTLTADDIDQLDRFEFEVNPEGHDHVSENDSVNNRTIMNKSELSFAYGKQLRILSVPIFLREWSLIGKGDLIRPTQKEVRTTRPMFHQTFPVPKPRYRSGYPQKVKLPFSLNDSVKIELLDQILKVFLVRLRIDNKTHDADLDAAFGWLPRSSLNVYGKDGKLSELFGRTRIGNYGLPVGFSVCRGPYSQSACAHEMNHMLGALKDDQDHSALTGTMGVDVGELCGFGTLKPKISYDLMAPDRKSEMVWISKDLYQKSLLDSKALQADCLPSRERLALDGEGAKALLISGTYDPETGAVRLDPVFREDTGESGPFDPEGILLVRAFLSLDGILPDVEVPFSPVQVGDEDTSDQVFVEEIPDPSVATRQVERIEIVEAGSGRVLATRLRSPNRPAVSIRSPAGGASLSEVTMVAWEAYDPDGGPLTFALYYSSDGGRSFDLLSGDIRDSGFELLPGELPGSEAGKAVLKVCASDGLNTSEAIVGGLTVAKKPPRIDLESPADGSFFFLGKSVPLAADVDDPETEELPDEGLRWSSDLDGPLATGPEAVVSGLSAGTHVLTVTATDPDGMESSESVTIRIVDRSRSCGPLEAVGGDCQKDGLPDACDIAWGLSEDTNGNGIPDECERAIEVSPLALDFGSLDVTDSKVLEVEARNVGAVPVSVRSFGVENRAGGAFAAVEGGSAPFTLAPGEARTLKVRCDAGWPGTARGVATIETDLPIDREIAVSLTANVLWGEKGPFRRGDTNADGRVDLSDAVCHVFWLFLGEPEPPCMDAADADDSGQVDVSDAIYELSWLFLDGPAPGNPGPDSCGLDTKEDGLGCLAFAPCLLEMP